LPEPDDLALLIGASRMAGETALARWRTAPTAWDKGGGLGPVSEADLEVDARLSDYLRAARPHYGWLSEESDEGAARLSAERVFIVDPIDGTRNFLEGKESWAVSLAVARRGEVETAVVALPARGRTFAATAGGGATADGSSIRASGRREISRAQVLAPRPALAADLWGARGAPPVERHFRPSLAYRLCLVAEGRFDAMMTFRDCWEWDIAAGALIATEAGAVVTDRNGRRLVFNLAAARTPGAVASTPALHGRLLPPPTIA
jgi:myo-inositol-1(or 4)-monophosphatase